MIKKRNLDSSLIQWIMTVTGLGPGVGEIFYVAPTSSSTSQFRTQWESVDIERDNEIYTSPADAYDAVEAGRNDVMLVAPGLYDLTAELAWNKDWTHVIGLGGPNTMGDPTLLGVTIYTDETDVAETVDCTGDRCQFINVNFSNYGNNAACLAAFNLDGWGCYFKNCAFVGTYHAAQANVEAAGSLYIDRLGHFPIFEDCIIGHNNWAARTLTGHAGQLRFVGTSEPRPQNGLFRRCRFFIKSGTDAYNHAVEVPQNHTMYGQWLFKDCQFHNYNENCATDADNVFHDAAMDTHSILLDGCSMHGFDEWQASDLGAAHFGISAPNAGTAGGIAVVPSAGA